MFIHFRVPLMQLFEQVTVGEGESCQGFILPVKVCASGLVCNMQGRLPDTGGTCVKDPNSGGSNPPPAPSPTPRPPPVPSPSPVRSPDSGNGTLPNGTTGGNK